MLKPRGILVKSQKKGKEKEKVEVKDDDVGDHDEKDQSDLNPVLEDMEKTNALEACIPKRHLF